MVRGLEVTVPSVFAGVCLSAACGLLCMLIFFVIDLFTNFRMSDWFAKGVWRRSPRAHILAHREKKRLAVLEAEKARRAAEIKVIAEYYAERRLQRRHDRAYWLREFNALTAEEDARTRPQDFSAPYITSQRYMEMMWGIESKKKRW